MIKCIIKMLFIIIILISLFILFNKKFVEKLENICTKCFVNPRDSKCIKIKEIKMDDTNDIYNLNVKLYDTSYIFCPWTNNCDNTNIISQEERLKLSNDELTTNQVFNNENNCCNNSDFYKNNISNFSKNNIIINNINNCTKINNLIKQNRDIIDESIIGDDYFKIRTLCNFNTDFSGSLFFIEEINKDQNILQNPDLSVDDILNMQNRLEIRYNTNNEDEKTEIKIKIYNLNNELKNLNLNSMKDLERKKTIQTELSNYYKTIKEKEYIYKLIDNNNNLQNNYNISKDETFNCFGNKEFLNKDISKNIFDKFFSENTRFSVSSDAPYKTQQDFVENNYPSQKDLELELKNLPNIEQTANAPVSIINLYMSSINRFYEKQLDNMLGPRTHNFQKSLTFDNDGLKINNNFFKYDTSANYTYDCKPSITGNNEFKYCGPMPYNNNITF